MALVIVIVLCVPAIPALGHETHTCAAPTHADLQQQHAGHHAVAEADVCAAVAALPDHNRECCGDQCNACVCPVCPASALIPDPKRPVVASVAGAAATLVAAAFDNFAADVPRAPPKPRS